MAGKSIESRETQGDTFDNALPHPEGPIRRFPHKVKTPDGRTVIIVDVHGEIREKTPRLKKS